MSVKESINKYISNELEEIYRKMRNISIPEEDIEIYKNLSSDSILLNIKDATEVQRPLLIKLYRLKKELEESNKVSRHWRNIAIPVLLGALFLGYKGCSQKAEIAKLTDKTTELTESNKTLGAEKNRLEGKLEQITDFYKNTIFHKEIANFKPEDLNEIIESISKENKDIKDNKKYEYYFHTENDKIKNNILEIRAKDGGKSYFIFFVNRNSEMDIEQYLADIKETKYRESKGSTSIEEIIEKLKDKPIKVFVYLTTQEEGVEENNE